MTRLTNSIEGARVAAPAADAAAAMEREMSINGTPVKKILMSSAAMMFAMVAVGCTPTLALGGGDKPITINLNVKIDQEIRYRLDKDLEDAIAKNPDLF